MIQFKEINGQLCKMLEKPVPLTPDAQFPCVVRLIQDDSPMGRFNSGKTAYIDDIYICDGIGEHGACAISNDGNLHHPACLEIIGYPVADGSAEWALWRMMQGDMVFHPSDEDRHPCKIDNDIVLCVGCGMRIKIDKWVEGCRQKDGWQIYTEPKPLLELCKVCKGTGKVYSCTKKSGKAGDKSGSYTISYTYDAVDCPACQATNH